MMYNIKEELETNKKGLELLLSENGDKCIDYKAQITRIEQELKDLGKPELTVSQLDDIYEAIEKAVDEYDFSDTDNYEIEYGIDYDGRVTCESLELCNHTDLVEMIVKEVTKLFVETKELDTTETDNHA